MKKINLALALFLILLAVSCETQKKILYFQDAVDGKVSQLQPIKKIVIRPDDKISIVVKSRDYNLTNLFNMPYFSQRIGSTNETVSTNSYTQGIASYLVDENGFIDFPVLGKIHVAGKTRSEIEQHIKSLLEEGDYVKEPTIVVDYVNLKVGVMGEVTAPGRYAIDHDVYTILDALSAAGDLTIYGNRDKVQVLRTEGDKKTTYFVNISSVDSLAASSAYYLQQNDIVYVEPNKMRARQSTVNGNNVLSASFWISVATLVSNLILYTINR